MKTVTGKEPKERSVSESFVVDMGTLEEEGETVRSIYIWGVGNKKRVIVGSQNSLMTV